MAQSFGPAPRTDPAYILQLASALAELQRVQTAHISRPTADYLANTPNEVILADATGGSLSVSLPAVKGFYGRTVFVKKMDASGNTVTIMPQGAETIDGVSSKVISAQYAGFTLMSTGTEWVVR